MFCFYFFTGSIDRESNMEKMVMPIVIGLMLVSWVSFLSVIVA